VVVDQELPPAATISGTVTEGWRDEMPELPGVVRAFRGSDWLPTATVETELDGTYTLDRLPGGTYRIQFSGPDWEPRQWFDGAWLRRHGTPLTVAAGESLTGVDAALSGGGLLEVLVRSADGTPIPGAFVAAYLDGAFLPAVTGTTGNGVTGPLGDVLLEPLPRGPIRVLVIVDDHWCCPLQWYDGVEDRASATPLPFDTITDTWIIVEFPIYEEDPCDLEPWKCEHL
jgi:hypothetical protein